jgi:cleavage stimulation factor subunit 3
MAIDADVLWSAYIKFISGWPDTDSGKVVALRKAYQRAVTVPCDGIDALWADYEAFERRTSEQLAANIIPDFQPRYQAAKAVYRDRKRLYSAVDLDQLATPPTNSRSELRQLHAWKSLLQAEQRNPSVLNDNEYKATMRHTFLLAVRCMRYHPEIWIYYAEHEITSGDTNAAKVVLKVCINSRCTKQQKGEDF